MRHSHIRMQVGARVRPRHAPVGSRGRRAAIGAIAHSFPGSAVMGICIAACMFGNLGCSPGRDQVEETAWSFVEAIKKQDTDTLERIMDWERYYAYGKEEGQETGQVSPQIDVEKEKNLLLTVLSRDRVLALTYLTSRHSIQNVSIDGEEARAEVLQVDRATGDERTVTLLLHRGENRDWKIYRFSTKPLNKNQD